MTTFFRQIWTRATTYTKIVGTFGVIGCLYSIVKHLYNTEYSDAFVMAALVYLFIDGLYWFQETKELRAALQPQAFYNTYFNYNISSDPDSADAAMVRLHKREQNLRNKSR